MKKIMLLIALAMSMASMAQVGVVNASQPTTKKKVFATHCIYIIMNVQARTYDMCLESTNGFERVYVRMPLGTKDEAVQSLQNLIDACVGKDDTIANINGYTIEFNKFGMYFQHKGKLADTYGDYIIAKSWLKQMKRWVEKQ